MQAPRRVPVDLRPAEASPFVDHSCMKNQRIASLLAFLLIYPNLAHAYVDPGTGAYLLQLLIALFGAIVFYATKPVQLFKLIRQFFRRKKRE